MSWHPGLSRSSSRLTWQALLSQGQGFTLIELMIVLLIVGILSGIALPNIIRQVGKAREAEAKQALSSIGFAQQGYFFENRQFATTYLELGVGISGTNYNFPDPETIPGTLRTKSQAISIDNGLTGSRDYALGVYYLSNSYAVLLCQATTIGVGTQVPDTVDGDCSNGGLKID